MAHSRSDSAKIPEQFVRIRDLPEQRQIEILLADITLKQVQIEKLEAQNKALLNKLCLIGNLVHGS